MLRVSTWEREERQISDHPLMSTRHWVYQKHMYINNYINIFRPVSFVRAKKCKCDVTYHPIGIVYAIHANFCYKSNNWRWFRIFRTTFHFQTVYPVLIISLENKTQKQTLLGPGNGDELCSLLCLSWLTVFCCCLKAFSTTTFCQSVVLEHTTITEMARWCAYITEVVW